MHIKNGFVIFRLVLINRVTPNPKQVMNPRKVAVDLNETKHLNSISDAVGLFEIHDQSRKAARRRK